MLAMLMSSSLDIARTRFCRDRETLESPSVCLCWHRQHWRGAGADRLLSSARLACVSVMLSTISTGAILELRSFARRRTRHAASCTASLGNPSA